MPGLLSDAFLKCTWEVMNKILKSGVEITELVSTESVLLPHVELFQKVVYYARDFP